MSETASAPAPPEPVVLDLEWLSREKYCSVWHSMRPDIEFTITFEVVPSVRS